MDRSLAGSSPLARLLRPFEPTLGPVGRGGRRRRRRRVPARGRTQALVGRGASAAAALAARALSVRAVRRLLVALLAAAVLLPGGWLLLRNSPLVAVEHVRVSGVRGAEAGAIESALVDAAHHMSTLEVSSAALLAAVAPFRVVHEVRATASFPHGLRITVVEQPPVAAVVASGQRTAVAANGVVLGPALLSSSLPTVQAPVQPLTGTRVGNQQLLAALTVLGAAPAALGRQVTSAYSGPRGLTVTMKSGLLVYFGDASRPHAKWLSLARVLADPSSAGASYVDVRLPTRPAAGFPPGVTPPAASSGGSAAEAGAAQTGGQESTVAALAAALGANAPGSTSSGTGSGPSGAGEASGSASAGAGESGSPSSASGAEASGAEASSSTSQEAHSSTGEVSPASPARGSEAGAAAGG